MINFYDLFWAYDKDTPFEKVGLSCEPFSLQFNQIVGIAGSTGSGKSTFVKLVSGLLDGRIRITKENEVFDPSDISYVFQQPEHQLFEETIEAELEFALRNFNVSEDLWPSLKSKALNHCGLTNILLDFCPLKLSGGQKRRLAIASVLVYGPSILILDEPLAGVDADSKNLLISMMKSYVSPSTLVLWVSHDHEALLEWADQIILFEDGSISHRGSVVRGIAECSVANPILRSFLSDKLKQCPSVNGRTIVHDLRRRMNE